MSVIKIFRVLPHRCQEVMAPSAKDEDKNVYFIRTRNAKAKCALGKHTTHNPNNASETYGQRQLCFF